MDSLLWLIPALPLAGFLAIILAGRKLPEKAAACIGVGSVGVSAVIGTLVACGSSSFVTQTLWQWIHVGSFQVDVTFRLDALSFAFILVITWVGFLILLYSAAFMAGDEGYRRFFAYMNLFVASMLVLVLADNLLLLYLGWEGVGLCSYLLIGFWYKTARNGRAAMKAFIVTRVGDAALAVALFIIFTGLGTLQIHEAQARAAELWTPGSGIAVAVALLLLAGAVGKSAQLPLQTWLPDAMAGPTPVSALIHAATMVTAGVYLIARTIGFFKLAPDVLLLVAVIGAATLLLAGFSALTQRDIKRVLAYSTMSQIGYMFLALGVGATGEGVFHFVTHACFKSLLFLGAGVVIIRMNDEHDMFKMGGLRRRMPLTFWCFLIAALALMAMPPTGGWASKDLILSEAQDSGHAWLWLAGLVGALITSLYTFRMVFLVFFGSPKVDPAAPIKDAGWVMGIPLVILAALCLLSGYLGKSLSGGEPGLLTASLGVSLLGILAAWVFYVRSPGLAAKLVRSGPAAFARRFWFDGWGFDHLYDTLFVQPLVWLARINRDDFVDAFFRALGWLSAFCNVALSRSENGRVRWYVAGVACGAIVLIVLLVML